MKTKKRNPSEKVSHVNYIKKRSDFTMKKQIKKRRKKYRISLFKVFMVMNFLLCSGLLIHDFIFWGIVPMFKGEFYQLTYLGLFLDIASILIVDASIQCFKEWTK